MIIDTVSINWNIWLHVFIRSFLIRGDSSRVQRSRVAGLSRLKDGDEVPDICHFVRLSFSSGRFRWVITAVTHFGSKFCFMYHFTCWTLIISRNYRKTRIIAIEKGESVVIMNTRRCHTFFGVFKGFYFGWGKGVFH